MYLARPAFQLSQERLDRELPRLPHLEEYALDYVRFSVPPTGPLVGELEVLPVLARIPCVVVPGRLSDPVERFDDVAVHDERSKGPGVTGVRPEVEKLRPVSRAKAMDAGSVDLGLLSVKCIECIDGRCLSSNIQGID